MALELPNTTLLFGAPNLGILLFLLAFLGWMDGKDILVPTTSLVFGASHAVSYVSIYVS